uniref:Uncharacterized protein n=1 Tax=Vitis vinifera TaxID=29760 RepID=A5AGL0_VITVI|nr:hypothetical protein VITISV_005700 [Vitis vinifera]
MATSASIDNSLQGEWIPSQMPRMGLNRDNRDNRKDCPEGVIANALGGVCVGSNWRVNRKCHEAPQSQMGQQSARRMGLNRDKRLNCDKRLNREWDSSLQGEWDNSLQGEWDSIANGTIVCKANGLSRKCREWDSIATIAGTVYKVSIANERVMRGIVCKASLLVREVGVITLKPEGRRSIANGTARRMDSIPNVANGTQSRQSQRLYAWRQSQMRE